MRNTFYNQEEYALIPKKEPVPQAITNLLVREKLHIQKDNVFYYKFINFSIEDFTSEELLALSTYYTPLDEHILSQLLIGKRQSKVIFLSKKNRELEKKTFDIKDENFDLKYYLIHKCLKPQSTHLLPIDLLITACRTPAKNSVNNYPWKLLGFLFLLDPIQTRNTILSNVFWLKEIREFEERESNNSSNTPLTSSVLIKLARKDREPDTSKLAIKVASPKSLINEILSFSFSNIIGERFKDLLPFQFIPLKYRAYKSNNLDELVNRIVETENIELFNALILERNFEGTFERFILKEHWRNLSQDQFKRLYIKFENQRQSIIKLFQIAHPNQNTLVGLHRLIIEPKGSYGVEPVFDAIKGWPTSHTNDVIYNNSTSQIKRRRSFSLASAALPLSESYIIENASAKLTSRTSQKTYTPLPSPADKIFDPNATFYEAGFFNELKNNKNEYESSEEAFLRKFYAGTRNFNKEFNNGRTISREESSTSRIIYKFSYRSLYSSFFPATNESKSELKKFIQKYDLETKKVKNKIAYKPVNKETKSLVIQSLIKYSKTPPTPKLLRSKLTITPK